MIKPITSISLFVFLCSGLFAQDFTGSNLNTRLIAENSVSKPSVVKMTIPANVEYPSILTEHAGEAKEYVETFCKNRRDYLIRIQQKGKKIFPKVNAILKKYNLPQELRVLIALESGFNPNAVSSAGAVGYWQFMDYAAKEYGLSIVAANEKNPAKLKKKDDRKNFQKSTQAAAKYLRDRSRNLDSDWLLVVASYNCGVGNVWEAIRKTGKSTATFWDVKKFLPAETRAYVMNFIALNVVFNNYDNFLKNQLRFSDKEIETLVSVNGPEEISSL